MNTEINRAAYWQSRAESYDNLNWVFDCGYINQIASVGDFETTDKVLDVGTGTGVIAYAISRLVELVIGIDISSNMLPQHDVDNLYFRKADITVLSDQYLNAFDKVTARMVFHHIIEDTWKAMDNCYDALKARGKMILAEGVPPINEVMDEYRAIMQLKEERLCFREEDLFSLMSEARFKNIKIYPHIIRQFSVKNWLQNNGLHQDIQEEIFRLHVEASGIFKQAYNMVITEDDCLIDTKNLILVGEK